MNSWSGMGFPTLKVSTNPSPMNLSIAPPLETASLHALR
jgi:hypothetical protein